MAHLALRFWIWMPLALTACRDTASEGAESSCAPLQLVERLTWYHDELPQRSPIRSPTGVAAGDLNGDGWQDLFIAWSGGSLWMRNDGDGGLELVDEPMANGDSLPDAVNVAIGDLDRDGDLDLSLGTWVEQPDLILWNNGEADFSIEQLPNSSGYSHSPAIADFNGDGWLDLFMARGLGDLDIVDILDEAPPASPSSLYLGSEAGFEDASDRLPHAIHASYSLHAALLDLEGDGDLDIYLANDFGPQVVPNQLISNDGGANFSMAEDCDCELPMYGMGTGVGDGNGDGLVDLYISDIGGPDYLINTGENSFYDATLASGAALPAQEDQLTSWGTAFVDMNQDGWMDLPIVFGRLSTQDAESVDQLNEDWVHGLQQRDALLLGIGDGLFENCESLGFDNSARNRNLVVADLDRDGQPELITAGREEISVNRFEGGCGSGVVLELGDGTGDPGIGARVELLADGRTSTQWLLPSTTSSSSSLELYLGMGTATEAEIHVQWLDGRTASATVSHPGQRLRLEPDSGP